MADELFGLPPLSEDVSAEPLIAPRPDVRQQAQKLNPILMALLPIAMAKGGREGVAGLLQGFSQAQQMRQQQSRQDASVQLQRDQFDATERYRREQLENQKRQQRQTFLEKFQTRLGDVDTDDEVRGLLDAFGTAGGDLGIERGALDQIAMQTVTPSKLQKRAAEKRIANLKSQFGAKWLEEGAKFLHDVGGERIGIQELLSRAGMIENPAAPKPEPKSDIALDVPLDRQHAAALASGNTGLAGTIEEAMRRQDATRRDPRDPVLNEIAQMRRDQMRNAPAPALPPNVQRRVDAKVRAFDMQPAVKRASVMAEAVTFATSLNPNTTNPADDQALIYAFAKAMDPESVVREGEYATVQRYAQSWAESFGFNAARLFSNTPFLTPQARQNMKATILAKFNAVRGQYDNLRKSYGKQIGQITGKDDGESYLTDYGGAFPEGAPTPPTPGAVPPNPYRR